MNAINAYTFAKASVDNRKELIRLLQTENLPVKDLPVSLNHFVIAIESGKLLGAIGMEAYGKFGLLRSLVVDKEYRNKNIASQLIERLENEAKENGIQTMFLLTETAPHYFEKKGYQRINRDEVPLSLKASSEFSHVCPVSAIVMKKQLH